MKSFKWIGVDESGKGDYFGYLVICGVIVSKEIEEKLNELGVRDSKKISDKRIRELSNILKRTLPYNIVRISPLKYNELYKKLKNINRILAWGHARVVENLLERHDADLLVFDKFSTKRYIEESIMKKAKKKRRLEIIKGERDIGVAASSIIARDEFISSLERMKRRWNFDFPKGAGRIVDEKGAEFVKRYGFSSLKNVAKIHFKNTEKIKALLQI